MPTFRVSELANVWVDDDTENESVPYTQRQVRRYECRYYDVPTLPDNWQTMTLDEQGQYCWDNGSVTWFYDEDTDDDVSEGNKTLSVERLDK